MKAAVREKRTGLTKKKKLTGILYKNGDEIREGDIIGSDRQPGGPHIIWNKEEVRWGLSDPEFDKRFTPAMCPLHGVYKGSIYKK